LVETEDDSTVDCRGRSKSLFFGVVVVVVFDLFYLLPRAGRFLPLPPA